MSVGDLLLDDAGNVRLDASGNAVCSNGGGDDCCCGANCPDGMCPAGSLYRVACGGAHQYVQRVTLDGGATRTAAGAAPFTIPFYEVGNGSGASDHIYGTTYPITAALAAAFTLSTPVALPGPQSGNYSTFGVDIWQGVYKRITIGGSTYVFDGTVGLGIALTSATFTMGHDATLWPDYPRSPDASNGDFGTGNKLVFDVLSGPETMAETLTVNSTLTAFPSVSAGTGLFQVYAAANGSLYAPAKLKGRWTGLNASGVETGPQPPTWIVAETTRSVAVSANGDNSTNVDVCHGVSTTANLVDYGGAAPSTIGTFTAKLVDPDGSEGISVGDYAARNCPCAIHVSGTLYVTVRTDTGKPIDENSPPKLDPESEDYESPPSALGPASIDVRMVRTAGKSCGHPGALWENVGPLHYNANGQSSLLTGKLTVGDTDYPLDYTELRRIGPRLYVLSGNFTGAETFDGESNSNGGGGAFSIHFTTEGDCPTNVADVEQFVQAFGIGRGGLFPGQVGYDSSLEPAVAFVNPAVTTPFTANDLDVEEVARETGDPACGCTESTPYQASLAAASHVQSILDADAAGGMA